MSLDGQLYATNKPGRDSFIYLFFDSGVTARLGLHYRLGRAADSPKAARAPQE